MVNPLLGNLMNKNYVTEDGIFTQEQLLIAKMIHDYDPELELVKVESHNPLVGEKPYALLHRPMGQMPYPVFFLDAGEIHHGLYARVFASDMAKAGMPLEDQLRANEMAHDLYKQAKEEEDFAEKRELAKSILKSKLHTYKHNGVVYR